MRCCPNWCIAPSRCRPSSTPWALLHELRQEPEPELEDLARRLVPVDILIVEGFKRHRHPKLEIIRPSLDRPRLHPDDPAIVAVAWAEPPDAAEAAALALPSFALADVSAIADFVLAEALPLEPRA